MEQKIIERINEISNNIDSLLTKRQDLLRDLKNTEKDIDISCGILHELKELLLQIQKDEDKYNNLKDKENPCN